MDHVAEQPARGQARALGATGALLGVVLVAVVFLLASGDSVAFLTGVTIGAAAFCLALVRLPRWRPLGTGILVGVAGTYLGVLVLFVLWLAGLAPA